MKNLDILCIGTALLDSIIKGFEYYPLLTSGYRAESGTLNVGGEAVNEAATAVKLGMKTGIMCYLGDDMAGDMIYSYLNRSGVDTSCVVREMYRSTPVTTMFVKDDGTRRSITNTAHSYNFHPERFRDKLTDTKAVILGSLFRAPFNDKDVIYQVLKSAKDAGALIFADTKIPNYLPLMLGDIYDSLPFIDYITPNEEEAAFYTHKETPEEMAEVFLEYGVKNVIIKLGHKGCYFRNAEKEYRLPACNINAVDATGAGDSFVAGFASELIRGESVYEALRFGNGCGAVCTTAVGATTALKSRDQVLKMINPD